MKEQKIQQAKPKLKRKLIIIVISSIVAFALIIIADHT